MIDKAFSQTAEKIRVFEQAIQDLKHFPAVSIPFFSALEMQRMRAEIDEFEFRTATPVVGNQVFQDFDVCFPAPLIGACQACARLLEALVAHCQKKDPGLCESEYTINDFAVQRYPKGSKGIGIHKDGLRYRQFVFIITLAGQSQFFVCADRQGTEKKIINDRAGQLVILAAPGFSGLKTAQDRPLHGVDDVAGGRLSIGFRYENPQ